MLGTDPVNHALDLAAFWVLAQRIKVDGALELHNMAVSILDDFVALDHVAVAQAHFSAQRQALPFGRRHFGKIVALDVDFARQWHVALTKLGMMRVKRCRPAAANGRIVVGQRDLDRIKHGHDARCAVFQIFAHGAFQH